MSDLNAIAHGIDSDSGEYLTSEQRKALFKKGKMKSPINTKAIRSGMITVSRSDAPKPGALARSSALVKQPKVEEKSEQAEFETDEVQTVFNQTKITFVNILKVKREKENLRDKYFKLLGKKKPAPVQEESEEDAPKKSGKMPFKVPKLNVMGLLGDLIQFAILDWIGKPENKKIVETFVKVFKVVAGFFDWFITGVVDNILTGFSELVGGDSIIERIGGFFKLAFGLVGLRWLLNPLKIFKDIGRVKKIIKSFAKMFKGTFAKGAKGMTKTFTNMLSLAGKTFQKTFGRLIKRFFLKLFGKTITKGIKKLGKIALKRGVGLVRRFPIIGPIIAFGIELAMGEPIGRAAFKAIGATLLAGIGTAFGGPVGTVLGGLAGEWAGGKLYDLFFKGKEGNKEETDKPELATGGIASGPKNGYLVMLHGTEVVIPINKLADILILPFQTLGAGIIGAMMGSVNSMGSAGTFIRPIMVSVLGPLLKVFGSEKYTVTDKVGKTQGSADTLTRHIERETEERDLDKFFEKDILKELGSALLMTGGNIFNSIMGGSAQAKSSSVGQQRVVGAQGGDYPSSTDTGNNSSVGNMPGSGASKGVKIAKMLQKDMGISAAAAAGIVGNLMLESGLQPDNVENGKGFDDGPISNIPVGTRRVGYGWGQWTNDRLEKFRKFLRSRGKENQPASDQDNYDYLLHELRTSEPIRGHWKGWQGPNIPEDDPAKAATWFMMNWERPGVPHQDQRQKYAKGIFKRLQSTSTETTQQSAAAPSPPATPGQNLSSEQKSSMFQKSGMSALAANALSSPQSSPQSSTPQATVSKNTQTSAMVPMSTNFSIDRKVKQTRSLSASTFIMNTQTNNRMNVQSAPLNSTSIGESILLNRI